VRVGNLLCFHHTVLSRRRVAWSSYGGRMRGTRKLFQTGLRRGARAIPLRTMNGSKTQLSRKPSWIFRGAMPKMRWRGSKGYLPLQFLSTRGSASCGPRLCSALAKAKLPRWSSTTSLPTGTWCFFPKMPKMPFCSRSRTLASAARALAGDIVVARQAYEQFFDIWKDADADIPILKEAKAEYAKLK